MGMSKHKVLVIEDDREIANLTALNLRDDGLEVDVVHDGVDGLDHALSGNYDLLILDLMLPGLDGLEICRRVRAHDPYVMILMLTAKSSELDRVLGLELGADDYLPKPFSLREVEARVKALLRRKTALEMKTEETGPKVLVAGELVIQLEAREVTLAGRPIRLTTREFDLLVQFARFPNRVFTRTQLLDFVWGHGYDGFEHTVNSHINRLRAKIEMDPAHPHFIQTVWGVGYRFAARVTQQ